VLIERATKRRAPDGRASVRVTLRNASAAMARPLAPLAPLTDGDAASEDAGGGAERALDGELRRAVGGELRNVFVSLKTDPGANGTTISSPYERRIARLGRDEEATVTFTLFRDVAELVVAVSVGDRVEERRVFLDRDGGTSRFAVQSTQLSQEVDLGAQALFDLRVVRLGAEGAARLAIGGLPAGVSAEFRDPESKARLTQIRFPEGEDERKLQLALTLPLRATSSVRPDVPVHFSVLASDATALDSLRPIGRTAPSSAAAAGRVDLELVPRGLPRIELRAQNLYHEVVPGDSVVTEVVVRNSGSRPLDGLRLRADPPAGWRAVFTPATLGALPVDAERPVRLVVRPPADAGVGDYETRVRVESAAAADRRLETEDKLLRLHVADRGTPLGSMTIVAILAAMVGGAGVVGRRWMRR